MNQEKSSWLPTAISVALLPPLWAVFSASIGIRFGWCALAGAGVYAAAGGKRELAMPISGGFLLGSFWGLAASALIGSNILPHTVLVFGTLCILGFAAVYLSLTHLRKWTCLPAWLGSWALSIGVMDSGEPRLLILLKLALTLMAGVWYVGVFSDWVAGRIRNWLLGKEPRKQKSFNCTPQ